MLELGLQEILAKKNITILQLSEETGISRSTLNNMVNENTKGVQFSTLNILCSFLSVAPEDILKFTPDVPEPEYRFSMVKPINDPEFSDYTTFKFLFFFSYNIWNREYWVCPIFKLSIVEHEESLALTMSIAGFQKFGIEDFIKARYGENYPYNKLPNTSSNKRAEREVTKKIIGKTEKSAIERIVQFYDIAVRYLNTNFPNYLQEIPINAQAITKFRESTQLESLDNFYSKETQKFVKEQISEEINQNNKNFFSLLYIFKIKRENKYLIDENFNATIKVTWPYNKPDSFEQYKVVENNG